MEKLSDEIMGNNISNNIEENQEGEATDQTDSETSSSDSSLPGVNVVEGSSDIETDHLDQSEEDAKEDSEPGSFIDLYEQSLKSIQEGELVSGEIVMIGKEHVLVDIGYKSEGQIRIHEFIDPEGNLTAKVGDKVDVLLEKSCLLYTSPSPRDRS